MRRTLAVLTAGCGQREVSTDAFEAQVGQAPDSVTCPDPRPTEKGEKVRCTLEADGTSYGTDVTTSAVDGDDVKLDIQVDDEPRRRCPVRVNPSVLCR